jgi:hypothetical protein
MKYLPIICAIYPNIMGLISAIMNQVDKKLVLEFKWEITFL